MAKQIHEKVAPVITWLRTAEEESDDEEEEEEEVEVVYSSKASNTGLITETIPTENVSWSSNVFYTIFKKCDYYFFHRVVTIVTLISMLFETYQQTDYTILVAIAVQ